MQKWLKLSNR